MLNIIKANSIQRTEFTKILIYGEPGIGKTTFGLSAPAPLLMDCDNGITRIDPSLRKDSVRIEKWTDLLEIFDTDISEYQTIVVDTVGKALDLLTIHILDTGSKMGNKDTLKLNFDGYRALMNGFKTFMLKCIQMKKHLILISHDREGTIDGDQRIVRPDIQGRTLPNILREVDLIGYIQSKDDLRTVSFDSTDVHYGKNTCQLPKSIKIPNLIGTQAAPLSDIINRFLKMQESTIEMQKKYNAIINLIQGNLEFVEDLETANTCLAVLKEQNKIWDSDFLCRKMLYEKCKPIGLVYNKVTELYQQGTMPKTNPEASNKPQAEPIEQKAGDNTDNPITDEFNKIIPEAAPEEKVYKKGKPTTTPNINFDNAK